MMSMGSVSNNKQYSLVHFLKTCFLNLIHLEIIWKFKINFKPNKNIGAIWGVPRWGVNFNSVVKPWVVKPSSRVVTKIEVYSNSDIRVYFMIGCWFISWLGVYFMIGCWFISWLGVYFMIGCLFHDWVSISWLGVGLFHDWVSISWLGVYFMIGCWFISWLGVYFMIGCLFHDWVSISWLVSACRKVKMARVICRGNRNTWGECVHDDMNSGIFRGAIGSWPPLAKKVFFFTIGKKFENIVWHPLCEH